MSAMYQQDDSARQAERALAFRREVRKRVDAALSGEKVILADEALTALELLDVKVTDRAHICQAVVKLGKARGAEETRQRALALAAAAIGYASSIPRSPAPRLTVVSDD